MGGKLSHLRERLASDPAVRYVEPDYLLERSRTPDDPFYLRQYALQPGGGGVSAPQAARAGLQAELRRPA
jgi:hypothetical protein